MLERFKTGLLIVGLLVFHNAMLGAQTTSSIPLSFSISSTGINRMLSAQWNDAGFQKSWSDSYNGMNYSIILKKPSVNLSDNTLKIILGLTINATSGGSTIYNGVVKLSPTLTIPESVISAENIYSQYTDLLNSINSISEFSDQNLKKVLYDVLSPITWVIYQGKILNGQTTRVYDYADIQLAGLPTVSFVIVNNELNLTITENIVHDVPQYTMYSFGETINGQKHFVMTFFATVNFEIKKITITMPNGTYAKTYNLQNCSPTLSGRWYQYRFDTGENPDNYDSNSQICTANVYYKRGSVEVIRKFTVLNAGAYYGSGYWNCATINTGSGSYGY